MTFRFLNFAPLLGVLLLAACDPASRTDAFLNDVESYINEAPDQKSSGLPPTGLPPTVSGMPPTGLPPTVSGRFGLETIDYNVFGNVLKVIFSHSIRSGVVTLTSLDLGISFQSSFSYSRPVSSVLVPGPTYGGRWEIRVESPGCNFLSLVFNADWLQTFHTDLP